MARVSTLHWVCSSAAACFAVSAVAREDPRVAWLKEHAVVLRTIDPRDDDFSDLEPLFPLIGDARIVQLGEQTHGDGACFHAKSRLAKFLHARMDFDLIVFESGFFDCRLVEEAFAGGIAPLEAAASGVFGIWSLSEQVRPLWEYISDTRAGDRPLQVAGFDSQITSGAGLSAIVPSISAFFSGIASEALTADRREAIERGVRHAASPKESTITRAEFDEFTRAVTALIEEVKRQAPQGDEHAREFAVQRRVLLNLRAFVSQMYWSGNPQQAARENMDLSGFREPFMADTLLFIARDLYPDRKIITWGASSHLMHGSAGVEWEQSPGVWGPDPSGFVPMGDPVREALGEEVYTIAFIAYGGAVGRPWTGITRIPDAPPESLDALCHQTGERFLFLDLRGPRLRNEPPWLLNPIVARPRGYMPMRARWPETCDAMIFTAWMYPSTRAIEVDP